MLKLTGNKKLSQQSVGAIQNLVASAVAELDRSNVTIVDASGNMLSAMDEQQPAGEGQGMLDYQAKLEQGYEVRLTSMLEQIVGSGQAIVRVTTAINREYVESNAKIYNPDEQVLRSSKTVKESRKAVDGVAMGVPGMTSNNPDSVNPDGSLATQNPPSEEATRNENTANYEISSRTEHRIVPFGTIEKVSIAVIVGGSYKEGESGDKTFVPRSDEELRSIKTLVQNAIGFNEDRGDTVEVQSMSLMDLSSAAAVDMEGVVDKTIYLELMRYGLAMLALILIAFFIMKPLAKRISESKTEELNALGLDANGLSTAGAESEHVAQMNKARSAVLNNPDRASRVVNEWVSSV
jgi:flagellar M-ring protein FliF